MELDDLKGLWQAQDAPSELDEATLQGIRDFDKKVKRDRLVIRVLLPLTCAYVLAMAVIFGGPFYVTGILVTIAAMLFFILRFRKIQQPGATGLLEGDSKKAIQKNLHTFHAYQRMAKRVTPLYGVILIIGQVISFLEFIQGYSLGMIILYSALYALGLALFFQLVYHLYMRKWRRKWQPIVDRLEEQMQEFS